MYCKCIRAEDFDHKNHDQGTGPAKPKLKSLSQNPLVAETPESALLYSITPNPLYFQRNHFPFPSIPGSSLNDWNIVLDESSDANSLINLKDLKAMPKATLSVTTECAGNNRLDVSPPVSGNQFESGAVSSAYWTGTPLSAVLTKMNLSPDVVEILFEGSDEGIPEPGQVKQAYQRSLPIDVAFHPDTILAYEMNGEEIPFEHGAPVRLIVPGWYGMASVKWLRKITALEKNFSGYFQTYKYVAKYLDGRSRFVTKMKLKSMITYPTVGKITSAETIPLKGFAWSGESRIEKVEVSTDSGYTWKAASLSESNSRYLWSQWHFDWDNPSKGHQTIVCRAIDSVGNLQPMQSEWNELGYEVNSANAICLDIE